MSASFIWIPFDSVMPNLLDGHHFRGLDDAVISVFHSEMRLQAQMVQCGFRFSHRGYRVLAGKAVGDDPRALHVVGRRKYRHTKGALCGTPSSNRSGDETLSDDKLVCAGMESRWRLRAFAGSQRAPRIVRRRFEGRSTRGRRRLLRRLCESQGRGPRETPRPRSTPV